MDVPAFDTEVATPGVDRVVFESPFGPWSLATSPPPPALSDCVVHLWETHGFTDYSREKILPQGTFELIFNLGGPHRTLHAESLQTAGTFRSAWISGLHETALIAAPDYDTLKYGALLVGASLTASGVHALFGASPRPLANVVVELEDLIGAAEIETVRERLFHAPSTQYRFATLAGFLRRRRERRGRDVSACVAWSLDLLRRAGGALRVEELTATCGISRKHLAAKFHDQVGLSPKRYARTLRFAALVKRLEAMRTPNWADLAVEYGYYDQAHLVREFRSFSGETPTEFLRCRSPDGQTIIYE